MAPDNQVKADTRHLIKVRALSLTLECDVVVFMQVQDQQYIRKQV